MQYLYGADLGKVQVTVQDSSVHIYNNVRLPYGTVPYGTLTEKNMYTLLPLRQVVLLFNIA